MPSPSAGGTGLHNGFSGRDPADIAWHHAALIPAELATIRYIAHSYWTDFSVGARLAADGARRLGPWQHMQLRTVKLRSGAAC